MFFLAKWPIKGIIKLSEHIKEVADKELNDVGEIKRQLAELQIQFELDEISEEEFEQKEDELLERLEAAMEESQNTSQ